MIDLEALANAVRDLDDPAGAGVGPVAKTLGELLIPTDDDPKELLKFRFLWRGGALLLVGPTGIGKSSFAMQAMILWALGLPAFGFTPARPLKSVLVQAENDEGDLAEMRDGVIRGLGLTPEQAAQACLNVLVVREDSQTRMAFVQLVLRPLLSTHRPDLLWIDPALAYLGGEASSQKDVGEFLRNMLNPLLHEFECGCILLHHSNKPATGTERREWQGGEFAYLGSGSIEWANWARGVIVLRSIGSHTVFELHVGKRGGRLRWKEADGVTPCYSKLIKHSSQPGVICWELAGPEDVPAGAKVARRPMKDDVLIHVPTDKPIWKDALRSKANGAGIAVNKINPLIAELIDEGVLHEWLVKRSGTRPKIMLARFPQADGELGV